MHLDLVELEPFSANPGGATLLWPSFGQACSFTRLSEIPMHRPEHRLSLDDTIIEV